MRKMCLSALAAVGILLGGCTTITLDQIQAAAVTACGFLPTAVQVSSLFPNLNQYTGTAASIAQSICTAVTAKVPLSAHRHALRMGAAQTPVSVNVTLPDGTVAVVSGYFVK